METRIELIDDETLALFFPYNPETIAAIKGLQHRRWNPRKRRWEVHLSSLAEVMGILGLTPRDVDEEILDRYRRGWSRHRLKVELDHLYGRLSGSGAPLKEIDRQTSFHMPGYKYSPKYIAGKWDGKRHLLNRRTQKFPAGLWPRVRRVLKDHQIDYQLVRKVRPPSPGKGPLQCGPERTPLRPYQSEACEAALKTRRGIIQIATGGGKTLLAAHLIRRVQQPAFFFVHTLELLYQAAELLGRELDTEIGILGDGRADLRPLTVATVQTAIRMCSSKPPTISNPEPIETEDEEETGPAEQPVTVDEATRQQIQEAIARSKVAIFDECHHVPADTFYKVAMQTARAGWRIGLSATPWRDDHHDLLLEAALGRKIHVTSCSDLIDQGFLVPPRIMMRPAPRPQRLGRGLRYPDYYRLAIVENQARNRVIATQARRWAEQGRSVLILVAQVAHGRQLQAVLPEAPFTHGSLDSQTRQRYLQNLERKLHPVLIATTLADEGLDVPNLGCVILAGGGKSPTRAYQRIGRALRPADGKSEARVLDFMDEVPYLQEHSRSRLELYRQEPRFQIEELEENA